ncbi:purine permease 1-like [Typha angustifolia]|uniref:purine permease 1-like n=1 Tax=Typha angustifolia TaxID=59011 RepID=UPI003C2DBF63
MATTIEVKEPMSSRSPPPPPPPPPPSRLLKLFLLLNATLMLFGAAAPLLLRLYFLHGGRRLWLSSFLQVCGWPLLLLPLPFSKSKHHLSLPLFISFFLIGLFTAISCYLYAFSTSYLPLSTSSLLASTQLAFTALFAFLVVKQRFTPYSFNAIVLLTLGPLVLSLCSTSDKLVGEAASKYYVAFFMCIAATAIVGLALPLMELAMRWSQTKITYGVVLEMQIVMGVAGTVFCLVGMVINGDFKVIAREAKEFGLGEAKYYMLLIWDAILWQLLNVGLVGLIYTSISALLAGIMVAALLPVAEILAVIFLHEKFDGGKAVALILALWGFISYLYGEKKRSRKLKQTALEMELPTASTP